MAKGTFLFTCDLRTSPTRVPSRRRSHISRRRKLDITLRQHSNRCRCASLASMQNVVFEEPVAHAECPMRPRRQGDTVIRPSPEQQRQIRRAGGSLFSKKHDRTAPPGSLKSTTTPSDELPSHSSAASGPENADNSDQSHLLDDGDTIMVHVSEPSSPDDTLRRSSRLKTPSKRAAEL